MNPNLLTRRADAMRSLSLVVLALASLCALAQPAVRPPGAPDAGQLLEQQRQPLRLPPPDEPVLPKAPEPKPALPASPQLKVTVQKFSFTGNTRYPEEALQAQVQEFIGKELDFEGLNEAATKVRSFYRTRGYFLAQAYLPQQTIREGAVEIGIIEGRVGEVDLANKHPDRLSDGLLLGILRTHLKQGQLITETGLEQPLLIINDLPGRVNVQDEGSTINGSVDADNQGNRFTGEYRLGTTLNWNTPLGYGDQANFRGFVSDEGMWYGRFAYLIPVGYYGTRVGVSYNKFEYRLAKDFANLGSHGDGEVKSIYGFHSIVRTRNTNVILQVSYENKRFIDEIDSQSSVEKRNINDYKLGLVGDFRDGFLGGGLNAYSFAWTHGELGIEPTSVLALDTGPTGHNTQGGFSKYNVDARRLQRVTDAFSVLLSVAGQKGMKNLASAEKFSLGGANGVRAFPVGEATGDIGMLATIEGRYIIPGFKIFSGDLTLTGFYDHGWARVNEHPLPTDTENNRSLGGYGVGMSAGQDGAFLVRAMAAWKTHGIAQSDTAQRVPRVWVQAIKWF